MTRGLGRGDLAEKLSLGLTVDLPADTLLASGFDLLQIAPPPNGDPALAHVRVLSGSPPSETVQPPSHADESWRWCGSAGVNNGSGLVWIGGIDPAAGSTKFDRLRLQFRVIRVREWTSHHLAPVDAKGAEGLVAGPFTLAAMSEPQEVWLSARVVDDLDRRGPQAVRLAELILPSFAAEYAEVVDACGRRLEPWGHPEYPALACRYRLPGDPAATPADVAYPVTVTLRLPAICDVEEATFDLRDVLFPPRTAFLVTTAR